MGGTDEDRIVGTGIRLSRGFHTGGRHSGMAFLPGVMGDFAGNGVFESLVFVISVEGIGTTACCRGVCGAGGFPISGKGGFGIDIGETALDGSDILSCLELTAVSSFF